MHLQVVLRPLSIYTVVLTVDLLISNLQAIAIIAMKYHLEHHILGREQAEQVQSM